MGVGEAVGVGGIVGVKVAVGVCVAKISGNLTPPEQAANPGRAASSKPMKIKYLRIVALYSTRKGVSMLTRVHPGSMMMTFHPIITGWADQTVERFLSGFN